MTLFSFSHCYHAMTWVSSSTTNFSSLSFHWDSLSQLHPSYINTSPQPKHSHHNPHKQTIETSISRPSLSLSLSLSLHYFSVFLVFTYLIRGVDFERERDGQWGNPLSTFYTCNARNPWCPSFWWLQVWGNW